jgi:hypothetical protein
VGEGTGMHNAHESEVKMDVDECKGEGCGWV